MIATPTRDRLGKSVDRIFRGDGRQALASTTHGIHRPTAEPGEYQLDWRRHDYKPFPQRDHEIVKHAVEIVVNVGSVREQHFAKALIAATLPGIEECLQRRAPGVDATSHIECRSKEIGVLLEVVPQLPP